MIRTRVVFVAIAWLTTALFRVATADAARLPWVAYGIEQGLPNEGGRQFRQDSEGFLWVESSGISYRFDGEKFIDPFSTEGMNDLGSTRDGSRFFSEEAAIVLIFKDQRRRWPVSGLSRASDYVSTPNGKIHWFWHAPTRDPTLPAGLSRLVDGRLETFPDPLVTVPQYVYFFLPSKTGDDLGNFWYTYRDHASNKDLFQRFSNGKFEDAMSFYKIPADVVPRQVIADGSGGVWLFGDRKLEEREAPSRFIAGWRESLSTRIERDTFSKI